MAEPVTEAKKRPLPPYIAFKTLTDLIERMEREEPPTQVDTTYLDSYAGGYRPTVINNLQTMGLLNKTGEPTPDLLALIEGDEATRKKLIGDMIHELYADVLTLGKNSTQGQLLEVFAAKGAQGDTRRKAITFFLKACKFAGISTGTHWKSPPATASGTSRRRTPRNNGKEQSNEGTTLPTPPAEGSGEVVVVKLGDAGEIVVNVNVRWLSLDDKTFVALRKAVNDMKALAAANELSVSAGSDDDTAEEEP